MIFDNIIVGAGPGGLLAAFKLASAGQSVLVLEAQKEVKRKVCGEYLCPTGVEILEKTKFSERLYNQFPKVFGMRIVESHGISIDTKFPEKNGKESYGLSVNRKTLEEWLIKEVENAGGIVTFDSAVSSFSYDGSSWGIETREGKNYRGRFLIGADGRRSFVAQHLGVRRNSSEKRIALHSLLQSKEMNNRYGEMHLFEDGSYIGLNPTGPREMNVSLVCNAELLKVHGNSYNLINYYLEKSDELKRRYLPIDKETKINSVFPITNKVDQISGKNWALIGDASGFLDPLTGEGMYNALFMADCLSEQLITNFEQTFLDFRVSCLAYEGKRAKILGEKSKLNKIFQTVIRRPFLTKLIAKFILAKKKRSDIFIGIIGNIYSPVAGILKIF